MNIGKTTKLALDFGNDGANLLPVVTQDVRSKDVLMVAFANRQALETTIETGLATYWSRTKGQLWTKGMTSGDLLKVMSIGVNCYQNSLLYMVEMQGDGVCHTKDEQGIAYPTCFYREISLDGGNLEFIARNQGKKEPSEKRYPFDTSGLHESIGLELDGIDPLDLGFKYLKKKD